jgi:hypothetical protein
MTVVVNTSEDRKLGRSLSASWVNLATTGCIKFNHRLYEALHIIMYARMQPDSLFLKQDSSLGGHQGTFRKPGWSADYSGTRLVPGISRPLLVEKAVRCHYP